MSLIFDSESPERGWEPFVEWLRALKVHPGDVRRVTIIGDSEYDERPMAEVEMIAYDRDGERAVDGLRGVICTYTRVGRVSRPPLHPDRKADAE